MREKNTQFQKSYIRDYDVAKKLGIGKSTVWYLLKAGQFIQPIKLSKSITIWDEAEIDEFISGKKINNKNNEFDESI